MAIAYGLVALVPTVISLTRADITVNLNLFWFPVGLGILWGAPVVRSLAILFSGFSLVVAAILVALRWIEIGQPFPIAGEPNLSIEMLSLLGMAYFFSVIWSASESPWFQADHGRQEAKPVMIVAILLTLFFLVTDEIEEFHSAKALREVYAYDFTLKVTDADTGEAVRHVAVSGPENHLEGVQVPQFMDFKGPTVMSYSDGMLRLEGYTRGPGKAVIQKKGYRPAEVEINRETGRMVEVHLKPISDK